MCGAVGCGQQRQLSTTADKRRAAKFLLLPTLRDRQPSTQPSADAKWLASVGRRFETCFHRRRKSGRRTDTGGIWLSAIDQSHSAEIREVWLPCTMLSA